MEDINNVRCGQTYDVDVNAAMAIQGQTLKKDLKELPFVVYLSLMPTMRDIGHMTIWQLSLKIVSVA